VKLHGKSDRSCITKPLSLLLPSNAKSGKSGRDFLYPFLQHLIQSIYIQRMMLVAQLIGILSG
jgi:hypothetical protein